MTNPVESQYNLDGFQRQVNQTESEVITDKDEVLGEPEVVEAPEPNEGVAVEGQPYEESVVAETERNFLDDETREALDNAVGNIKFTGEKVSTIYARILREVTKNIPEDEEGYQAAYLLRTSYCAEKLLVLIKDFDEQVEREKAFLENQGIARTQESVYSKVLARATVLHYLLVE